MLLRLLRQHRYELIAFFTGAAVMILEIVGARLIAPYFGLSTYVWTAMIGVILGALAVGYWLGGIMADRADPKLLLGVLLTASSILVLGIGFIQTAVLSSLASFEFDLRLSAFIAAIILFAPASLIIGTISPHLAKIRIQSLETSGRSVGKLEAAGALGSIAGTFSCGYILLGYFGSRSIVIGIALLLLLTSILAAPRGMRLLRSLVVATGLLLTPTLLANPSNVLADIDTSYARYQVSEGKYGEQVAVLLSTDVRGIQSAVSVSNPSDPILTYIQRFNDAAISFGRPGSLLVIGGGAYTFPSILVDSNPAVKVDVAEIDGRLISLAREYFYLSDSTRLHAIPEDGRTYLNSATTKYDMIFVDAFTSSTPPFQLTTLEAVRHMERILRSDGVVVVNTIDEGPSHAFSTALRATYAKVFSEVRVYQASYSVVDKNVRQNFMLYASNDPAAIRRATATQSGQLDLVESGRLLTDDYAPIERLTN